MKPLSILFVLMLAIGLTACSAASQASQAPAAQATLPKETSSPPLTATPTPQPRSRLPLSEGLLLTQFDAANKLDMLSVVDPANGYALAGFEPINLGVNSAYALAPDGKTLAAVAYQSQDNPHDANLYLINLNDWSLRKIDLGINEWITSLVYAQDSRYLVVNVSQTNGQVLILDTQQARIIKQAEIGVSIRKLQFSQDGTSLLVYGVPADPQTEVSSDSPVAGLVDVNNLNWLWRASLPGLRDGVYPKPGKANDLYTPGNADRFAPGLVFAPTKNTLYIVNAEKDELISVDFDLRTATTHPIRPELTWLEHLLNLGASAAQAKGMPGNEKNAVISADGRYLYVMSMKNEITSGGSNGPEFNQVPQGIQIIRAADAVETQRIDTNVSEFVLSGNGKFIYLYDWSTGLPVTEIFDITQKKIIASVKDAYLTPTRLINGKPVLVSSYMVGNNEDTRLAVFENDSARLIQSWTSSASANWLIFP